MALNPAKEGCDALYTAVVRDATGAVVPGGQITGMRLTLYYKGGALNGQYVNSRNYVDVWSSGTNEVSVDANGVLTFWFKPADNVIGDDRQKIEIHRAEFRWTTATRVGKWWVDVPVENFKVAA